MEERLPRKLAAILYADVAGYSRLTGEDEDATHRRLSEYLDLISQTVERHRGRVMHYAGDAVLAMFEAVVDALVCGARIQRELNTRNEALPDERRVQFRVGVNLGDVIEDRGDIYGDGVNVAARLEALAEPGGICVSESVRTATGQRLPIDFQYLGEQQVKNIVEPVRAYHVRLQAGVELPGLGEQAKSTQPSKAGTWRWYAVAVVVVVVIAGSVLGWLKPWERRDEPESIEQTAYPLPDKPSIAVLPFLNMSGDEEQEYFSDGISEDLITDLSKISALTVIARTSSFVYKGQTPDLRDVGKELGVRYLLEGSVRKVGNRIRINAQLVDAATGSHLWAERYDGSYDDVFALQDKVTARIVTTLAVKLTAGEQDRIDRKETQNTQAYDTFLKGWEQYQRQRPESFTQAIAHFERAIELDPSYSRAYAALSATYWQIWKRYWHREFGMESPHDPRFKAEEYLLETKRQPTSLSLQVSTAMLSQQGYHNEALAEGERAITLDPNDADGFVALAGALNLAGQHSKALEFVEQAIRLNPSFPANYLYELGLSQFSMDNFEDAAASLEKATALNPDDRWSLRLLLATNGHLGRVTAAANILNLAETNWGGLDPLSIRSVLFWYPFKEARDRERLADGLRKAGVPE